MAKESSSLSYNHNNRIFSPRACSSVDRALASEAKGRRSDSCQAHQQRTRLKRALSNSLYRISYVIFTFAVIVWVPPGVGSPPPPPSPSRAKKVSP